MKPEELRRRAWTVGFALGNQAARESRIAYADRAELARFLLAQLAPLGPWGVLGALQAVDVWIDFPEATVPAARSMWFTPQVEEGKRGERSLEWGLRPQEDAAPIPGYPFAFDRWTELAERPSAQSMQARALELGLAEPLPAGADVSTLGALASVVGIELAASEDTRRAVGLPLVRRSAFFEGTAARSSKASGLSASSSSGVGGGLALAIGLALAAWVLSRR